MTAHKLKKTEGTFNLFVLIVFFVQLNIIIIKTIFLQNITMLRITEKSVGYYIIIDKRTLPT